MQTEPLTSRVLCKRSPLIRRLFGVAVYVFHNRDTILGKMAKPAFEQHGDFKIITRQAAPAALRLSGKKEIMVHSPLDQGWINYRIFADRNPIKLFRQKGFIKIYNQKTEWPNRRLLSTSRKKKKSV